MIHGYHVVMPMYGFWLPNDPRGSNSDFVRSWELLRFGRATKSLERNSTVDFSDEDKALRETMLASLRYPIVVLDGQQAHLIAKSFGAHAQRNNYTIWACAILPQHTHLVLARHSFNAETMVNQLKGAATRALTKADRHPLAKYVTKAGRTPPMWAAHQWVVYLDSELAIEQAIHYVEQNPVKEGKKRQYWPFVSPFTGIDSHVWTNYH